jgi:hypothetical protein
MEEESPYGDIEYSTRSESDIIGFGAADLFANPADAPEPTCTSQAAEADDWEKDDDDEYDSAIRSGLLSAHSDDDWEQVPREDADGSEIPRDHFPLAPTNRTLVARAGAARTAVVHYIATHQPSDDEKAAMYQTAKDIVDGSLTVGKSTAMFVGQCARWGFHITRDITLDVAKAVGQAIIEVQQ